MISRISFLLAGAAGLVLLASSAISTQVAADCSFEGRDFSSLTGKDWEFTTPTTSKYTYALRVCGRLQKGCVKESSSTAMCQLDTSASVRFDLGEEPGRYNWGLINPKFPGLGVGYQLVGANNCWNGASTEPYVTNVNFVCGATGGPTAVTQGCLTTVTFPTDLACTPPENICKFSGLDFSKLTTADIMAPTTDTWQYWLRPCGTLSRGCVQGERNSACLAFPSVAGGNIALGNINATSQIPVWSWIDPSNHTVGATYQIIGDSGCRESEFKSFLTNVNMYCTQNPGVMTVTTLAQTDCTFNYTIPTPLACPHGHPWSEAAHADEKPHHRHSKRPITKILTELF